MGRWTCMKVLRENRKNTSRKIYHFKILPGSRAVETLVGGEVYTYTVFQYNPVLPGRFPFKLINLNLI